MAVCTFHISTYSYIILITYSRDRCQSMFQLGIHTSYSMIIPPCTPRIAPSFMCHQQTSQGEAASACLLRLPPWHPFAWSPSAKSKSTPSGFNVPLGSTRHPSSSSQESPKSQNNTRRHTGPVLVHTHRWYCTILHSPPWNAQKILWNVGGEPEIVVIILTMPLHTVSVVVCCTRIGLASGPHVSARSKWLSTPKVQSQFASPGLPQRHPLRQIHCRLVDYKYIT